MHRYCHKKIADCRFSGGEPGSGYGDGNTAGSGSYPQNSYFAFDCPGKRKSSTGPGWKNHHGSFTLTGNVPFPVTYDFNNPARYTLCTATDTSGPGMSSPLQVRGESSSCSGIPIDCKPCHFVFNGEIYAGGMMVYNGSAGSNQRWTVVFTRMPGGENGIWHTRSLTQTECGCEVTDIEAVGPIEVILPADGCFTNDAGTKSGTPFAFSDGSGFVVSPHVDYGNIEFTCLNPRVVFHPGKAPL